MAKHSSSVKKTNSVIVDTTPVAVDTTPVKSSKVVRKTKPAAEAVVPAVPVVTPEPVTPVPTTTAAAVQSVEVTATPAAVETTEDAAVTKPAKNKKRAAKSRVYQDILVQMRDDIDVAYKRIQSAFKLINSLESAHNREVSVTKTRETTRRTPTILFDEQLVAYYRSKLTPEELVVNHKEGENKVALSLGDLSTSTRLHRTDVTQLYNLIFKKYNMQDPSDGRIINYKGDAELISVLTSGNLKPELAEDVAALKAGTYKLTIFNIQRFTNQHLSKFETPAAEEASTASA